MPDRLNHIEVAELGQIKVNAKIGSNIRWAVAECVVLANLLKVAVELYFNGRKIDVYIDTNIDDVVKKYLSETGGV